MESLKIPNSSIELYEGSVVILARFPDLKWVVHHGWYTYNKQQCSGWYFSSIPSNTVLPVSADDLRLITVVAKSGGCPPVPPESFPPSCPYPPRPGPCPPRPGPCPPTPFLPKDFIKELNASFIVVQNIAQRKKLDTDRFPDGKMICVNDVEGERKYYRWKKSMADWEEFILTPDLEPFITKEEAFDTFTTSQQVQYLIDTSFDNIEEIIEETINTTVGPRIDSIDSSISALSDTLDDHISNTYIKSDVDDLIDVAKEDMKDYTDEAMAWKTLEG